MKILRNIATKLATGEVTKLCAILIKLKKNSNFAHVKIEPMIFILFVGVWVYVKSFTIFYISKFSRISKN